MSSKENKLQINNLEIVNVLQGLRDKVIAEIDIEGIKKGKRKRFKKVVNIIDKINTNLNHCLESTGSCDGLRMTIAKGDHRSRKIKGADYIISNLVDNQQPVQHFGTSQHRYTVTYYPTFDKNIFIEDTKHQTKIQAPRRIRLVGINILNKTRSKEK